MANTAEIKEHSEVVGSDGQHVGTVDKVEGNRIKLTKNDSSAGGEHHYVETSLVESVEGSTVRLTQSAAEAKRLWENSENSAATGASGVGSGGSM